jgi:hypothetical protein
MVIRHRRQWEVYFSHLPGGEYNAYAVLTDAAGHRRAIARQPVRILSMYGGR